MQDAAAIRQVPLFSQMDDQEVAAVHALMDPIAHRPQEVIMREGEAGDLFYVVVEGHVQVIIRDASGQELVVNEIGPGGFFGELSMLTGDPRSARVKAVDEVRTLALDRDEFFDFLLKHPHAALDVLSELARRQLRTDELIRNSVSRNVNEISDERLTLGQRVADTVADTMGSWRFITFQSTLLSIWIVLNITAWLQHWDPYPFILLNLALSFQAAYAAPFIMMSQNRQAAKDRLSAEIDHQVNAKAELEIGLLLQRLDDLERAVQLNHREQQALIRTVNGEASG